MQNLVHGSAVELTAKYVELCRANKQQCNHITFAVALWEMALQSGMNVYPSHFVDMARALMTHYWELNDAALQRKKARLVAAGLDVIHRPGKTVLIRPDGEMSAFATLRAAVEFGGADGQTQGECRAYIVQTEDAFQVI